MKTGTSCVLTSFWLFSVDSLFSREVELLKTRRFVKHLKSLRVLILDFDPLFFTDGLHDPKAFYKVKMMNDDLYKWWRTYQLLVNVFNKWRIYQGKTTDSFLKKKTIGINTLLLLKPWFTDNAFSEQKKPILQLNKEIVDYLWKRFLPEERKALEYCFR